MENESLNQDVQSVQRTLEAKKSKSVSSLGQDFFLIGFGILIVILVVFCIVRLLAWI